MIHTFNTRPKRLSKFPREPRYHPRVVNRNPIRMTLRVSQLHPRCYCHLVSALSHACAFKISQRLTSTAIVSGMGPIEARAKLRVNHTRHTEEEWNFYISFPQVRFERIFFSSSARSQEKPLCLNLFGRQYQPINSFVPQSSKSYMGLSWLAVRMEKRYLQSD